MSNTALTSCSSVASTAKWSIGYFFEKVVRGPKKVENRCVKPCDGEGVMKRLVMLHKGETFLQGVDQRSL